MMHDRGLPSITTRKIQKIIPVRCLPDCLPVLAHPVADQHINADAFHCLIGTSMLTHFSGS
jgi:hypothetical protein